MKDILKELRIRLANPFILSFAISWLFWNWPITIGLLWYNAENIRLFDYKSYNHLIAENANFCRNYAYPFLFALGYIILAPLFRLIVNWYNAHIKKRDENNVLKISEDGKVSISKYLELSKDYKEKLKDLSNLIEEENAKTKEYANQINGLNEIIAKNNQEKHFQAEISNHTAIDGTWNIVYQPEMFLGEKKEKITFTPFEISIKDGEVFNSISEEATKLGIIQHYSYAPDNKILTLSFLIDKTFENSEIYKFNRVINLYEVTIENGNIIRLESISRAISINKLK